MPKRSTYPEKTPDFLGLRGSQVFMWARHGLAATADQGIASAASLLATILLARWLTMEEFGGYALALAVFQFALQFQNGMILEPMSVLGPGKHRADILPYISGQMRLGLLMLFGAAAAAMALAFVLARMHFLSAAAGALFALCVSLPFMTLPWMVRRILYVIGRPQRAAAASFVFAFVLVSALMGLRAMGWLSPGTAIGASALAGLSTGAFVLPVVFRRSASSGSHGPKSLLAENWTYGKWSTLTGLLVATAVQAQLLIAGGILGIAASGVIRAAQNLIQPMAISITAVAAAALPSMARDAGRSNFQHLALKARWMTTVLASLSLLYLAVLVIFREDVSGLLYGDQYRRFTNIFVIWGFVPLVMALNSGLGTGLRARQRPELGLLVAVVWSLLSVGLGLWLTSSFGMTGASVSALMGYLAAYIITIILSRRAFGSSVATGSSPPTGAAPGSASTSAPSSSDWSAM